MLSHLEKIRAARKTPVFDFGSYLSDAVKALNDAGISPMDVPKANRQAAYRLEPQIHDAVVEKRQDDFVRLVGEWRKCFENNEAVK